MVSDTNKTLAAYAFFRELYDSKKNIYDVIADFLAEIIISKKMANFHLADITNLINEEYGFQLPSAIIKKSLKKLELNNDGNLYTSNFCDKTKFDELKTIKKELEAKNRKLFNRLFEYISNKRNQVLSDTEKEQIASEFCLTLIERSGTHECSTEIFEFILECEKNENLSSQLSIIKEGVIINTALNHTNNLENIGHWNKKNNLIIFLGKEILLDATGLSGKFFESLFKEFLALVKKVNKIHDNYELIQLKYLTEAKKEIDEFFKTAENLVHRNKFVKTTATAMHKITSDCNSRSDVLSKKVDFERKLEELRIYEDKYNEYFTPENNKYNIIDKETLKKFSVVQEDINYYCTVLNKVNIRRQRIKNSSKDIETSGAIFITRKNLASKASKELNNDKTGKFWLAIDIFDATTLLWFKLNEGFGHSKLLNFNVATKIKIVASTMINNKISEKFDEVNEAFEKGFITKEKAVFEIKSISKYVKNPEQITCENIETDLHSLSRNDVKNTINEYAFLKTEVIKKDNELKKANSELEYFKKIEKEKKARNIKFFKLLKKVCISIIILLVAISIFIFFETKIVGGLAAICTIMPFFNKDKFITAYLKIVNKSNDDS
ncbi:hypothetical protein AAEX28_01880 [Lentisphaerota bacterium WC36G]|nr:hypothetical protein LJT99_04765 [Lentisphaerae bacterium WC36]